MRPVMALLFSACVPAGSPTLLIDGRDPALVQQHGALHYAGRPFTGTLIDDSDGRYVQHVPYRLGLRHGNARAYYADGTLAYDRTFAFGLREGVHSGFWPGGQVQFVYRYAHDVFDGEQVAYYKNGVRSELRHFQGGREEGRQQIWDGQARLTTNYIVKEGRRYGIVGRSDCVAVH